MSENGNSKVALVTGASSGIGLELARLAHKDGYRLVLVARSKPRLDELARMLDPKGRIVVLPKDLAATNAPREIFDELKGRGLDVDLLVNNAGFAVYGPYVETDGKREQEMIQLNILALTNLTKLFLPGMVKRGRGRVINVASTAAFLPGPLMAVYYATKAYVLSYSEALANEMKGTGVTVTALCPGPTETGFAHTAKVENTRLFASGQVHVMDAATVARIGYEAAVCGKTVVVPGFQNKLVVQSGRITPRNILTEIVRRVQERTK
jgi:short-subunit dehydrogenase